jgi:hypothetical protein
LSVTGEWDVTLPVAGDVESARSRIAVALEKLGYRVTSENPMQAKRKASGWGMMSNTVFDYPRTLSVSFKPASEGSTLVTFDYTIMDGIPIAGWQRTLMREAEAAVALTTQYVQSANCPACGEQSGAQSRFCRRCGSPLATSEPAMEMLRLTSHVEAARLSTILVAISSAILFAILMAMLLAGASHLKVLIALMALGIPVCAAMYFNLRRLNRALNPNDQELPQSRPPSISLPDNTDPTRLSEVPPSITENTTGLLETSDPALSVRQRGRDTA